MRLLTDRSKLAAAMLLALAAVPAFAEEEAAEEPAKEAAEEKEKPVAPPGLPAGVDWEFNFDATFDTFGFNNSLYRSPRPDQPSGDLGDNWSEGTVKGALGGAYTNRNSSQFYGKVSG